MRSLKSTYLQFFRRYIFVSFRKVVGINCTFRRHTVLDFCRHQQGWPWMTLNAGFNLKCALRTARLTYVRCGFRSWPCVTEWTWALIVSDKNVANELWFQSICGLYDFSPGFTKRGQWIRVEPLNLVIIHIMQHHLSDVLRCVAILYSCTTGIRCTVKFTIIERAEKDVRSWRAVSLR